MHEHKTQHCDHDLKLCVDCDVVYCHKCQRDWGKEKIVYRERVVERPVRNPYVYPQYIPYVDPPPYLPYSSSSDDFTVRWVTTNAHTHSQQ